MPAEIFQVKMFIVQEHCQILSCPFRTWRCPRLAQNCFEYTGLIILLAALSGCSQAAEAGNSLLSPIFSAQCHNLFITNQTNKNPIEQTKKKSTTKGLSG